MGEAIYRALYSAAGMQPTASVNTFQFRVLSFGLLAAAIVTLITESLLAGFSFVALAAVIGLLWRRDGIQVLPFVLGYQWLQIVAGYFFSLAYGYFPGTPQAGSLGEAVWLSLLGLIVLALGIRFGDFLLHQMLPRRATRAEPARTCYNVHWLFWLVIL